MIEAINEKVSVVFIYNRDEKTAIPSLVRWQGEVRRIGKIGYHHKIREGRTVCHIFHVTDGNLAYKLKFDTDALTWTLLEVADGTSN